MITSTHSDPDVDALLSANKHPLRKELDALRVIILDADERIREGVKWNAASFRTSDWFATLNGPKHITEPMLILHAGAKVNGIDLKSAVKDPNNLMDWRGSERAIITFSSRDDIQAKKSELQHLIRMWIRHI